MMVQSIIGSLFWKNIFVVIFGCKSCGNYTVFRKSRTFQVTKVNELYP